jgi:hypothetical protein
VTSESNESEARRWLIEPAAANEMKVSIRIGEEASLTPEIQAALEQLMMAMQGGAEVQGFCDAFQTRNCYALSTCFGMSPACPSYSIMCQIDPSTGRCIVYTG